MSGLFFASNFNFSVKKLLLFFTKDFDKDDIVFGSFLTNNLVYSSKKYNTKNKILKEKSFKFPIISIIGYLSC